jgi:chromatin segregation and condensation protein Rec8/ScpA/Scc1 (kleisin family)
MSNNEISSIRVLLNPDLVKRLNPWELKIYVLLELFKKYLEEAKSADFRLSGIAISTSSLIYEMKVKKILYEPKRREQVKEEIPLNINVSLQPYVPLEIPVVDLDELIEAFKEMIKALTKRQEMIPRGIEPSSLPVINETLAIEIIKKYESFVLSLLKEKGKSSIYDILKGKTPLEVIRVFLAILLLLSDKKIEIDETMNLFLSKQVDFS